MSTIINECNIPGGLLVRLQDASTYSQLWHQAWGNEIGNLPWFYKLINQDIVAFWHPKVKWRSLFFSFFECWMQMILSYFVIFCLSTSNLAVSWRGLRNARPGKVQSSLIQPTKTNPMLTGGWQVPKWPVCDGTQKRSLKCFSSWSPARCSTPNTWEIGFWGLSGLRFVAFSELSRCNLVVFEKMLKHRCSKRNDTNSPDEKTPVKSTYVLFTYTYIVYYCTICFVWECHELVSFRQEVQPCNPRMNLLMAL